MMIDVHPRTSYTCVDPLLNTVVTTNRQVIVNAAPSLELLGTSSVKITKVKKADGNQGPPGWFELLGGGNSDILGIFTPIFGEMIQFDLRIFFNWVGSTTN